MNRFLHQLLKNLMIILVGSFSVSLNADSATSLRCYVCGPGESLSDCDNFNHSNQNLYAKECPPDSLSCTRIRTKDSVRSMACENQRINDCKFMNHTEYCYCIFDLCNGNKSIKESITVSSIDLNDDEDLMEGSGYNQIFPSTGTAISTRYSTIEPPNTGDCLRSTFIVIAASILLP